MRTFPFGLFLTLLLATLALAEEADDPIEQLKDADAAVRRKAAETLGQQKGEAAKAAVPALAAALKDKDTDVRIQAAYSLGRLGADAKSALPALIGAAKDTSNVGQVLRPTLPSSVCDAAIAAALKIDPDCGPSLAKEALADLTAAVNSKDPAVVQAAGYALGKLGPHAKSALPALQAAAKNAKGFGAASAIDGAIAAIEGPGVYYGKLVKDSNQPLTKRLDALAHLRWKEPVDDATIAVFVAALKDPEPGIRARAAIELRPLGKQAKGAIPTLLDLLDDEKLEKAETGLIPAFAGDNRVARALASMGLEAVPGLVAVLQDNTKKTIVRYRAANALAGMGRRAKAALPALEAALKDDEPSVAVESACAYLLAGGDPEKAVPVLRKGLRSRSPSVLWNAANAIERVGQPAQDAVEDLLPLLGSRDRETRIVAARALCKMGAAAGPAVTAIADLLKEPDPRQRYQIEVALGNLGPDVRKAVPALIERFDDLEKNPRSPHPILETLGKIGPKAKAAVPALIELLKEAKEFYIKDTMDTLGLIGPGAEEAVPVIVAHLKDKSEYTRAAAARALGGIGPDAKPAVPALKKLLEDQSRQVRVWAAFALARITGDAKPHVALMIEMWTEDKGDEGPFAGQARGDIARALVRLGPEARPARDLLLEALPEMSALGTLSEVAHALGNLHDDADVIVPKMIAVVERKLEPSSRLRWNREAAIEVLGALGPKAKAAVPTLRKFLDSEEDGIAEAAAKALEKIETK